MSSSVLARPSVGILGAAPLTALARPPAATPIISDNEGLSPSARCDQLTTTTPPDEVLPRYRGDRNQVTLQSTDWGSSRSSPPRRVKTLPDVFHRRHLTAPLRSVRA